MLSHFHSISRIKCNKTCCDNDYRLLYLQLFPTVDCEDTKRVSYPLYTYCLTYSKVFFYRSQILKSLPRNAIAYNNDKVTICLIFYLYLPMMVDFIDVM